MQLNEGEMSFLGHVLTWIIIIFGGGRAWGKISAKVESADEKATKAQEAVNTVSADLEAALNVGGEPRFLTYAAHDIIRSHCHENLDIRLSVITSSVQGARDEIGQVRGELKEIGKAINKLTVDQAKHHAHQRETDRNE